MKSLLICCVALISLTNNSLSQIDTIRIYVRSGDLTLPDESTVPHKIFTSSPIIERNSQIYVFDEGETIYVRLINEDSESHGLKVDGLFEITSTLPNDSSGMEVNFNNPGIFRYYDPLNGIYNPYLGLSGIMHVKESGNVLPYFYWDLREYQTEWNNSIVLSGTPDPLTYAPRYFTINGNSTPEIDEDPLAKILGNVGQELRLIILNNGQSIHSIHFHGYHATIISSSKDSGHIGRSKDTFPVFSGESVELSVIPDKTGEYPIHDHNLVAVTGGGIYHAGMLTTIVIAP